MVLRATTGAGAQQYVVLPGKVVPVSDFVARLLLFSPQTGRLQQHNAPTAVDAQSFTPESGNLFAEKNWPQQAAEQANAAAAPGRRTPCAACCARCPRHGGTDLSTWAGADYPAAVVNGGTSAYVTPGTGLLYPQIQAGDEANGLTFLVTDTGLRYGVQTNNDSNAKPLRHRRGRPGQNRTTRPPRDQQARRRDTAAGDPPGANAARLQDIEFPCASRRTGRSSCRWRPRLDIKAARQPQGS